METVLRYELSADGKSLKKYIRNRDPVATAPDEVFYHVHSDKMTELERWIHGLLGNIFPARCKRCGHVRYVTGRMIFDAHNKG